MQQTGNIFLARVAGVLKIIVQVPHNKRNAVGWACFPCAPKRIHPRSVIGGDVGPHHIESFVPRDELEGQEVGGDQAKLDKES